MNREAMLPPNDAATPRILGIDAARGGAILLVVLLHASLPMNGQLPSWLALINRLGDGVRMPLLLFMSGFLARSLVDNIEKSRRRAADLFWIYAVWGLIGLLAGTWTALWMVLLPFNGLWYIWGLAFAALIMPFTSRLPRECVIGSYVVLAMISYAGIIRTDPSTLDHLLQQQVFFYVGLYYGTDLTRHVWKRPWLFLAVMLGAAVVTFVGNEFLRRVVGFPVLALPVRLFLVLAVLSACLLLPRIMALVLAWFGRRSMPIYVGHIIMMEPIRELVTRLPGGDQPTEQVLVVAACSVAISLVLYRSAGPLRLGFLYRRPGRPLALEQDRRTSPAGSSI